MNWVHLRSTAAEIEIQAKLVPDRFCFFGQESSNGVNQSETTSDRLSPGHFGPATGSRSQNNEAEFSKGKLRLAR